MAGASHCDKNFDVVCLYQIEVVNNTEYADDKESDPGLNKSAVDGDKKEADAPDNLLLWPDTLGLIRSLKRIEDHQHNGEQHYYHKDPAEQLVINR